MHTFSINVTDDMTFEGPEDFTLTLVTSDTGATLMPRMTQVSIVDDEGILKHNIASGNYLGHLKLLPLTYRSPCNV